MRAVLLLLVLVSAGCSASTACALGGKCPTTSAASTAAPLPKMRRHDVGRYHYARCVETSDGSDCR